MRCPRITVEKGEDGLYHCMSRIVGGDYIFDKVEKEVFIQRMWRLAEFLGIAVLDYVVMSNHYHQLLGVPGVVERGQGTGKLSGRQTIRPISLQSHFRQAPARQGRRSLSPG